MSQKLDVDQAVRRRYSEAAMGKKPDLCCPVDYDPRYLAALPDEIIERDYGCGDPSRHLSAGDIVLDLGSGGGKVCYIASQVVGESGKVIGVDCNDEMLALARKHQSAVAEKLGYSNVEFRRGRIQDLALDLDAFDRLLAENPVQNAAQWQAALTQAAELRAGRPLVRDGSVTAVVSNCVLNLVRREDRHQLFSEIHRVLADGGRAVISDIVCDEDVPDDLRNDPTLWSGCLSGAFREDEFCEAFVRGGFYGVEIIERQSEPWAVVEGIEFRSLTLRAWKGTAGPCLERRQSVVYRGPWSSVADDDGHRLYRGQRMAVCDKTYQAYTSAPYADDIIAVPPATEIPPEAAAPFDCTQDRIRPASETKHGASRLTVRPDDDCCGSTGCC